MTISFKQECYSCKNLMRNIVDEHSTNSGPKSAGKVLQFGGSSQVNIKNINNASVSHFSTGKKLKLECWNPQIDFLCKCFSFLKKGLFQGPC